MKMMMRGGEVVAIARRSCMRSATARRPAATASGWVHVNARSYVSSGVNMG
jgi:hypothetical protein